MARVRFTVTTTFPVAPELVWNALTAWATHGRWIPATSMQIVHGDGGVGTQFIARTGIGAFAFDDVMVVEEFDPVFRCATVVKQGRLLTGDAGFSIDADPIGSQVTWSEDVLVRGVPALLSGPLRIVARAAFRLSLRRLASQLG